MFYVFKKLKLGFMFFPEPQQYMVAHFLSTNDIATASSRARQRCPACSVWLHRCGSRRRRRRRRTKTTGREKERDAQPVLIGCGCRLLFNEGLQFCIPAPPRYNTSRNHAGSIPSNFYTMQESSQINFGQNQNCSFSRFSTIFVNICVFLCF